MKSLDKIFDFDIRRSVADIRGLRCGVRRGATPNETVMIDADSSEDSLFRLQCDGDLDRWNGTTDAWFDDQETTNPNKWVFLDDQLASGDAFDDAAKWAAGAVPLIHYRTGIHDAQVGGLRRFGLRVANTQQRLTQVLCLVLVYLATKRMRLEFCGHSDDSGSMVAHMEPWQRWIRWSRPKE